MAKSNRNLVGDALDIFVEGNLVESKGSGQAVEILANKIEILGQADAEEYPLQPKKHSLEFFR